MIKSSGGRCKSQFLEVAYDESESVGNSDTASVGNKNIRIWIYGRSKVRGTLWKSGNEFLTELSMGHKRLGRNTDKKFNDGAWRMHCLEFNDISGGLQLKKFYILV